MREKSPGKGESWQAEPRDPAILPMGRVSWQPEPTSGEADLILLRKSTHFLPSSVDSVFFIVLVSRM